MLMTGRSSFVTANRNDRDRVSLDFLLTLCTYKLIIKVTRDCGIDIEILIIRNLYARHQIELTDARPVKDDGQARRDHGAEHGFVYILFLFIMDRFFIFILLFYPVVLSTFSAYAHKIM